MTKAMDIYSIMDHKHAHTKGSLHLLRTCLKFVEDNDIADLIKLILYMQGSVLFILVNLAPVL